VTAPLVKPMTSGSVHVTGTSGPAIYSYSRQPEAADVQVVQHLQQIPALQEEMEKLRRAAAAQKEQIGQLGQQLSETREGKLRIQMELDAARLEVSRLGEELSLERMAREQAEAAAVEGQQALERNLSEREAWPSYVGPPASAYAPSCNHGGQTASFGLPGGRMSRDSAASASAGGSLDGAMEAEALETGAPDPLAVAGATRCAERPSGAIPVATSPPQPADQEPAAAAMERRPSRASQRRGSAKDDVDAKLLDFLQNTDCNLVFRRKNRGWYLFRHADESGKPSSNDRSVEMSIVNGKLMARVEPSGPHDKGWNNSKLGPVERFVNFFSVA